MRLCALALVIATVALSGCVLGVGIGGKSCDETHACVPGYVCLATVCVAEADLRDGGVVLAEGEGEGDPAEGEGDAGEGEGDAGEGEGDAGEGEGEPVDGGVCHPAADGIERCNDFDDNCTGGVDEGCDNGCVDDATFPGAFISVCATPHSFQSARTLCQERGLELAVLDDARFSDQVRGDVTDVVQSEGHEVWIGATDSAVEGKFVWLDGSPLRFEDFDSDGQPNDFGSGQDCLEIRDSLFWNDEDCTALNSFVCAQKPPPITYTFCSGVPVDNDGDGVDCDTDCDDNDDTVGPDHIEVCGDRVDNDCDGVIDEACANCSDLVEGGVFCTRPTVWAEAKDKCDDLGLQLGKIETQTLEDATVAALVDAAADDRCWIGLNDIAVEGTFTWVDGAALGPLAPFEANEPTGGTDQNCGSIRDRDPLGVDGGPDGDGTYGWGDEPCANRHAAYLCTP